MHSPATSKDEKGDFVEDVGLSILDVVKYATLVISQSLTPTDRLSIVTYTDTAELVLPPLSMTEEHKEKVKRTLSGIVPLRSTNLFAGLKLGVQQGWNLGSDYISSIFVLTDGLPNIHPPLGYDRSVAKLFGQQGLFGTVSTFGFGYSLNSQLLVNVAKMGGGTFSFIPDSGMVGTCFINALANVKCTFGVNPVLHIKGVNVDLLTKEGYILKQEQPKHLQPDANKKALSNDDGDDNNNNEEETPTLKGLTVDEALYCTIKGNVVKVHLNPLRYGSNVDVVLNPLLFVPSTTTTTPEVTVTFQIPSGKTLSLSTNLGESNAKDEFYHSKRVQFTRDAYFICCDDRFDETRTDVFLQSAITEDAPSSNNLEALYKDMTGQASEAISSKKYYTSWGRHFLWSLSTAHLHQFCNNFKDPGVQVYGTGKLFSELKDKLDDLFGELDPPVPSRAVGNNAAMGRMPSSTTNQNARGWFGSRPTSNTTPSNVSMNAFNNQNNVCVDGNTKVTIRSREEEESAEMTVKVPISTVRKGDYVLTSSSFKNNGVFAKVECLVETVAEEDDCRPFELICIGNTNQEEQLCVTPYHPIRLNDQSGWQFPIDILQNCTTTAASTASANSVYNLVLVQGERHHPVLMNGIESITLGHGVRTDAILEHAYFGTKAVVDDLQRDTKGWSNGHVVLRESDIKRCDDPSSGGGGRICRINVTKAGTKSSRKMKEIVVEVPVLHKAVDINSTATATLVSCIV